MKTNEFFKYLYLLTFIFFNLSFNRLAEFGMDKGGQLLIVLLIIKLFETITQNNNEKKIENILLLIPLLGFCISIKTFLTYSILGLTIFIINKNYFKICINHFQSHFFFFFDINFYIFSSFHFNRMFNISFTYYVLVKILMGKDLNEVKSFQSGWNNGPQVQVHLCY